MQKSRLGSLAVLLLLCVSLLPAMAPAHALTSTIGVSYNDADSTVTPDIYINYTSGGIEHDFQNLTWTAQWFSMDIGTNWTIVYQVSNGTDRWTADFTTDTPVAVNGTQYNCTYIHETYDTFSVGDEGGGYVSTTGGWIGGETPSVTATPYAGFVFVAWYESGPVLVSTSATFTPTHGGDYVAAFSRSETATCDTVTTQFTGILGLGVLIVLALIVGAIFLVLGKAGEGGGAGEVMFMPIFVVAISIVLALGFIILYSLQNAICI